jgi:2-C-methyl-D-erythritol 4-phosphate cytidylyltransferase
MAESGLPPHPDRDGATGPIWGLVVAGGSGSRFGGWKQFGMIGAETVVARALGSLVPVVDGAVIVLPAELVAELPSRASVLERCGVDPALLPAGLTLEVVPGGATRARSVRAGLSAVPADCEIVLVHDAARPLASADLAEAVVTAVRGGADGAIPALPLVDTVKRVQDGVVLETIDREQLVRVQTPQGFRAGVLRSAHAGNAEATDDAALVEQAGGRVVVVLGEEHNLKLTAPEDLALAQWWLGQSTTEAV